MNAPAKIVLPFLLAASTAAWAMGSQSRSEAAAVDSETLAMSTTKIVCDGLIGNGSGGPNGRDFYYHVVPGDDPVDRVDIGCDYNQLSLFTSVEVPNGWTFGVIDAGAHFIHDLKFTPHGRTTTVVNGTCEYKLRFTGPPLSTPFGLGFDFLGEPHEVHWKVTGGTQTDWTKRVGQGKGPIHSPGFQDGPVEQQPGESSDASHGHDHGHH